MNARVDLWPVAIIEDRYNGVHSTSGGKWLAIAEADKSWNDLAAQSRADFCLVDGPSGDDNDAMDFWDNPPDWIADGMTPDEALAALYAQIPEVPIVTRP